MHLKWRIDTGRYPVFVRNKQINTCSEIIDGLLKGKGSVEHTQAYETGDKTNRLMTIYEVSPYISFMDEKIKQIQSDALEKAIKERVITPAFKSTIWYGKQS